MNYDAIPGRHAMKWIIDDALKTTPRGGTWVEVGVALGKGIAYMGKRLIETGRDDVMLYAVDPWGGYARNGEQQANGKATEHGDWQLFLDTMLTNAPEVLRRLHIIRADSYWAAQATRDGTVDLCILDADHTYDAVDVDIRAWWPKMRASTGVMGGDDHVPDYPGVQGACEKWFGKDYEHEARELGWETWRKVGGW